MFRSYTLKHIGLCKTEPPCGSHSVETFFLNDLKRYWPYIQYVYKAKAHGLQDPTKNGACNYIFCVRILLDLRNYQNFKSFLFQWILVYQFCPQRSEFPIVFNIVVNMFWRAEGIVCMWGLLTFGPYNKFFFIRFFFI